MGPQKSIYSSIQPINSSIDPPINSSTHQLIDSTVQLKNTIVDELIIPSTHRFNPLTHQLTRRGSLFFRLEFWLRFLIVLGSFFISLWMPKWIPEGGGIVLMGPLGPPGRSRGCLGPLRWLSWGSGSGFGYSEASLGVVLVCSWGCLGACWGLSSARWSPFFWL